MPNIRLGLCCHNLDLKYNNGVFTGRTVRLSTIEKYGIPVLIDTANKNIDDLGKIFEWCIEHGIHLFRMSSDLIPHGSNLKLVKIIGEEEAKKYMNMTYFESKFKKLRKIIDGKIRVTFHPGQFDQVGTPNADVFNRTKLDLYMHARILDLLGAPHQSIIIVHGGGTYGDKVNTIIRWKKQYNELPSIVKKYLVLENDETCYSPNDLIPLCEDIGIPFLFDTFHYECYDIYHGKGSQWTIDEIIPKLLSIWKKHNKKPKFHVSEQSPTKKTLGSHATIVKKLPQYILDLPKKYNVDIDIMIEAKGKEVALAHLFKTYPDINPNVKQLPDKIPYKAKKDILIDDAEWLCKKT